MADNEITLVDLVRDSKIETRSLDPHVVEHVLYETGRSARRRRVPKTERWIKGRQLGQGTFGTVHLQTCKDGSGNRFRAVKEVKKFVVVGQELDYTRELEAIMKFSNDKYNHCFVSSQGWYELEDAICITMEYFELGDLQQYIDTPLQEDEGREITDQILEGLAFMHENGFIHRDLKPANIMVVDKSPEWFVKIADFGISKRRHHDTSLLTMQRGTLGFAAPEVIGSTSDQSYTYSADMWSLGAMVYRILTSQMAFDSIGDLFKFVHDDLEFPVGPLELCNISQRGREFVFMLMESRPGSRGSAVSARNHPWLIEPLTPTKGEDSHRPEADNTEMVRNTDLSVPSKVWSSDEEPSLFPSRKARTSLETLSSTRYHALQPPSTDLTMSISQEKGHSSNAHPPEPDSTAKPEIMDGSDAQFEGPVNNAPARSALKSYPSFERPVWQSSNHTDKYEYQDSDECTDEENSVSSICPSSSASRPANHQSKSKLRRVVNICRMCKLEPYLNWIWATPREALSCGHFVCDSCLRQQIYAVFICPDLKALFCCESLIIDEDMLRRLITNWDIGSRWQGYWNLARSPGWRCPEGHLISQRPVMEHESGILLWKMVMRCDQCSPLTLDATYCVFCSRKMRGFMECNKCAHDLVIWPFILRLGAFSLPWIREAIDHASNARTAAWRGRNSQIVGRVTSTANQRPRRPKPKRGFNKSLPSWEFLDSGPGGPAPSLLGHARAGAALPYSQVQEVRNHQAQDIQYSPMPEHSEGNIEAPGAYQRAPGDNTLDEVSIGPCNFCGALDLEVNFSDRTIVRCRVCRAKTCLTCSQSGHRWTYCRCHVTVSMLGPSSRDKTTPTRPKNPSEYKVSRAYPISRHHDPYDG
ncbi:hypothetical protein LCI18_009353 [Fusarium solani-melongenae]|uniref:Uncharacterized protein n=1 Tax=Fusarium solani subsp. cucurbitae TaxID=2747967 RepID=A0ACD3ZEA4_FUSSC|nr:hypothetical protein LCI18_009353 [Fusarium solani-melongenae]